MMAPTRVPDSDALARVLGVAQADVVSLVGLMRRAAIDELEIECQQTRVLLQRRGEPEQGVAGAGDSTTTAELEEPLHAITAPAVGWFKPAVSVNDEVDLDQVLGTLQTLAVTRPIKSSARGGVRYVCAGGVAEFGQKLVVIQRERSGR
jgi:biotin carboxyl carrier protein